MSDGESSGLNIGREVFGASRSTVAIASPNLELPPSVFRSVNPRGRPWLSARATLLHDTGPLGNIGAERIVRWPVHSNDVVAKLAEILLRHYVMAHFQGSSLDVN